jgi:hypothetical protein
VQRIICAWLQRSQCWQWLDVAAIQGHKVRSARLVPPARPDLSVLRVRKGHKACRVPLGHKARLGRKVRKGKLALKGRLAPWGHPVQRALLDHPAQRAPWGRLGHPAQRGRKGRLDHPVRKVREPPQYDS